MNYFMFILLFVFLIGCQSLNHQRESLLSSSEGDRTPQTANEFSELELKEKKPLISSLIEKKEKHRIEDVPVELRPEVEVWIRYFTSRGRDRMKLYLERSKRYENLMRTALSRENLPENLVYMAMIESGFSPVARSRANAVGYWQFISSTGRRYGLKINQFVDERRDPVLSTVAAGKYLKDLHDLFGSWYLAMASYNAGEYRVNRAMMKYYTRDFWKLSHRKSIPRETREYVPKFMAAQLISEDPEKYGFTNLNYQKPIEFESVAIHKSISLKKLSKSLSLPHSDMKMLNPIYVTDYIPVPQNKSVVLRVPLGFSEKVTSEVITASIMSRPKNVNTYVYYKVRWGDTLYGLAQRNRTTVNTIARMNGISSRHTLKAGRVIKLPPRYSSSTLAQASPTFHKVRKGESLGKISRKYNVSVAQLKSLNRLPASLIIHPGQILTLKKAPKASSTKRTHIVRKGETLIGISKKYQVQLVTLMNMNSLNFKSILKVGQRIHIPE